MRLTHFLAPLALVTVACGGHKGGSALAYYESEDPRSLDPAFSTDVQTGEMVSYLYDGLTQFDPEGKLLPDLSDRWTTSEDGRRFVFHLRAGVKFHDGRPLTVGAVRASLLRVLSPTSTGGRAWPLYPIAGAREYAAGTASDVRGIELLGDTAIALTLTEPLAIFPKFLAMPVAGIVPDPAPPDLSAHPVGTGPWKLVAWQHDDYLLFAKNPDYWAGPPAADTLSVRIIPEPLTQAAEFEAGRLSVVEIPFGETARWRAEHPDWLVRQPALRVTYVALNTTRGPLKDVRVRQALNLAVNVPQILATVWAGRGIRARGSIPPTLAGGDTTRAAYPYDTAQARRLLTAAGYPRGFDIQLWRSTSRPELNRVAQAIQSDLGAVGVRVEIVERDAASQREAARSGKADMALLDWWADYPDADNFLFPLFHSSNFGAGGNYAFYKDAVTDSLIMQARHTTDDAARAALYRQADDRVYRAAPWIYLWFPVDLWARSPKITGWNLAVIFQGQRWTGVSRQP
ncbi:MAG TPA: ABC transporter substrate-binding protein [Gemmatimonadales bacterium]|nr:ABC transporter substrate-binding protein [Gemmatimonadales bacterium]